MRHLLLKEFILQGFLSRVGAGALEALLVLAVVLRHLPHLEKIGILNFRPKCRSHQPGHSHQPWQEP